MQDQSDARSARAIIFWLAALVALLAPASAAAAQTTAGIGAAELSPRLLADASWHGRPIQRPWRVQRIALHADAADTASLRRGTGFARTSGSDRVRRLQRQLTRLGYRPGRIDGLFGPRTQAAVIAFQRKHGLPRTGVVGSVTMRALRRRIVGRPAVHTASTISPARSEPTQTGPPANPKNGTPLGRSSAVEITPMMLVLGFMLLLPVAVLVVPPTLRRRQRRRLAPARSIAARNPSSSKLLLPPEATRRAIGYAAGHERGLVRQAEEIAVGCDRRRLELVEVVRDVVAGGSTAYDRPGLRRVLTRVSDGDATTVVVSGLDRLGASDEEIRGVLSTLAHRRGSVLALNTQEMRRWPHEAAIRTPTEEDGRGNGQ